MKSYIIHKLPESAKAPVFEEGFCPCSMPFGFEAASRAELSAYPWASAGYCPEACAWLGWNEKGIHVLMAARELVIRAEVAEIGGRVCQDSCLEFFLMPDPERSGRYVNIEVNPRAVAHIGLGDGRHQREVLSALPEGFDGAYSRHEGDWWAIGYTVPAAFLLREFGVVLEAGMRMRGNFYKCGDMTANPHWGMWKAYDLPAPDFHRPELFGEMVLG